VLAFFGNLAPMEMLLLAVVAVLVFGKRLPEVAGRGFTQLRRWRQSLDQLRRDSGIDRELHNIERSVRDASRQAYVEGDVEGDRVGEEVSEAVGSSESGADKGQESAEGTGVSASDVP